MPAPAGDNFARGFFGTIARAAAITGAGYLDARTSPASSGYAQTASYGDYRKDQDDKLKATAPPELKKLILDIEGEAVQAGPRFGADPSTGFSGTFQISARP